METYFDWKGRSLEDKLEEAMQYVNNIEKVKVDFGCSYKGKDYPLDDEEAKKTYNLILDDVATLELKIEERDNTDGWTEEEKEYAFNYFLQQDLDEAARYGII